MRELATTMTGPARLHQEAALPWVEEERDRTYDLVCPAQPVDYASQVAVNLTVSSSGITSKHSCEREN